MTEGIVPGFDKPVALIGIAEKGYLSLELVVEAEGGHSSMPPAHTAVGVLSSAIARLGDKPFPATISDPVRQQFAFLGPEQGWLSCRKQGWGRMAEPEQILKAISQLLN